MNTEMGAQPDVRDASALEHQREREREREESSVDEMPV